MLLTFLVLSCPPFTASAGQAAGDPRSDPTVPVPSTRLYPTTSITSVLNAHSLDSFRVTKSRCARGVSVISLPLCVWTETCGRWVSLVGFNIYPFEVGLAEGGHQVACLNPTIFFKELESFYVVDIYYLIIDLMYLSMMAGAEDNYILGKEGGVPFDELTICPLLATRGLKGTNKHPVV